MDNSLEIGHSPDLNYDNCIITQHEDSNSLLSFGSDDNSQPKDQSDELDATCHQIVHCELELGEFFFFATGLLDRIMLHLSNKNDNNKPDKEWVIRQINFLQTAFSCNQDLFLVENQDIKESYISKRNFKVTAKNKKIINNPETQNSENRIRSKRIHDRKDKEVIICDRLTYTSLKLPSFTSTPKPDKNNMKKKTKNLNETKKKKNDEILNANSESELQIASKKINSGIVKNMKASTILPVLHSNSRRNLTRNKSKVTGKLISKSLPLNITEGSHKCFNKEDDVQNKNPEESTSQKAFMGQQKIISKNAFSKKRREISLDGIPNKKQKRDDVKSVSFISSSVGESISSSGSSKRKLYDAESWINSLRLPEN